MKYLIMDGRWHTDPDNSVCFEVCDTKEEANKRKKNYGTDCVILESEDLDAQKE